MITNKQHQDIGASESSFSGFEVSFTSAQCVDILVRLCCPRGPAPWLAKHGIDLCLVDLEDLGHVSASSTQMNVHVLDGNALQILL